MGSVNYYFDKMAVSFVEALSYRNLGSLERRDWTLVNMFCSKVISTVLLSYRGGLWVYGELGRSALKNWERSGSIEKIFTSHCSSGLFALKPSFFLATCERLKEASKTSSYKRSVF